MDGMTWDAMKLCNSNAEHALGAFGGPLWRQRCCLSALDSRVLSEACLARLSSSPSRPGLGLLE